MNTATSHSRSKRLLSLLAALAMVASLAIVNASPAFASGNGWARLTAGVTVLPGTNVDYGIVVEPQDEAITHVVIAVPEGIGLSIPSQALDQHGFTGKLVNFGNGQRLQFTGGSIPADGSANFKFLANVAAPTTASQSSGTFGVSLSADGQTFEQATAGDRSPLTNNGTLTTTIKFLEVTAVWTRLPAGIKDGTGTEGQGIRVWVQVKNYALTNLAVTTSLSASSNGNNGFTSDETISSPESKTIAANSAVWWGFGVTLGTARQNGNPANRPVTFSASPVADASGAIGIGNSMGFTVQVLGKMNLVGSSFEPRLVAPGTGKTFNVDAGRSGTPSFTINQASISFGNNTAALGTNPTFAPGGETKSLTYTGDVVDESGKHDVFYSYSATDDNGHSYTVSDVALTERSSGLLGTGLNATNQPVTVTIDGLGPIIDNIEIDLPNDADGRAQTEAKDGDAITVSGTITDEVSDAWVTEVTLVTAGGALITTAVPTDNGSGDGSWSVTFPGDQIDFVGATGQFSALVTGVDEPGNPGAGASDLVGFDNIVPRLTFARVESTTELNLDGLLGFTGNPAVITARFAENAIIKGGCDTRQWMVDGQNIVREVRYSDGTLCSPGAEGPDNDRVLVLSVPIERGATPLVRYTPMAGDRVGDRAGNLAPEDTVTAVNGILPAIPDLLDVFRNTTANPEDCQVADGEKSPCEHAYQDSGADGTGDTDSYWTRFTGNDTVVCLAGARVGYKVQVTDGNGNTKSTVNAPDTTPCVRVDLGSTDGTQTLGLRYVNDAGAGEELLVDFGLDTVKPTVSTITQSGNDITVDFDDFLIAGTNQPLDWAVRERAPNGSITNDPPRSVATPCSGTPLNTTCSTGVRDIEANLDDPQDGFLGLSYLVNTGTRYEDRGGNTLADFLNAS